MSIRIDGTNTTANPGITGGDADTGLQFGTDEIQFVTGGTARVTVDSTGGLDAGAFTVDGSAPADSVNLDSSGRLLVGTSSASTNGLLTVQCDTNQDGIVLRAENIGGQGSQPGIVFEGPTGTELVNLYVDNNASELRINTAGTERIRITSDGILTNKTAGIGSVTSFQGFSLGPRSDGYAIFSRDAANPVFINRFTDDGGLVGFFQNGTAEGDISVSGSTVSYNGAHLSRWSQLAGGAERIEILRGSVLSNLDEMCEWTYEAKEAIYYTEEDELPEGVSVGDIKELGREAGTENNEQLNRMKISDVEGDPNVAGIFQGWDNEDETYTNDFYCAMTGDFIIRIAEGVTVQRGDLLMSAGDGTAKPQDDDIIRSKTVAKVTSTHVTCTYDDGSYCVPCVLMAC